MRYMRIRCQSCGRYVDPGAAGVSSWQTWSYCMDGSPDLHDPVFQCSPCTDKHGYEFSNCHPPEAYQWRNPAGRSALQEQGKMSGRCWKPGCGALKLVGRPCSDFDCPQDWTVKRLTAAGYRLLGPDELDPVTIERCAEVAAAYGTLPGFPDGKTGAFRKHRHAIAAAIRALETKP